MVTPAPNGVGLIVPEMLNAPTPVPLIATTGDETELVPENVAVATTVPGAVGEKVKRTVCDALGAKLLGTPDTENDALPLITAIMPVTVPVPVLDKVTGIELVPPTVTLPSSRCSAQPRAFRRRR